MKRLMMLALPLLAVGAVADDVQIKGRLKFVDPSPEITLLVDTDHGLKRVSFGPSENWRGRMLWLDDNDLISVTGHTKPGSDVIVAEHVWVNGNYYNLPGSPMRSVSTGSTSSTMVGVREALNPTISLAREVTAGWMDEPKKAADFMIDKYGAPDELTDHRMIWRNNGPWKMSILTNEEIPHNFPMPHHDMLLQVIDYKVPVNMFDEVAEYDGSVVVDRTKGELGARCDKEAANFLAVNLANDVATGAKSPEAARQFYAETISAMMAGNMTSQQRDYTSKFVFSVPRSNTADPDRRHGG